MIKRKQNLRLEAHSGSPILRSVVELLSRCQGLAIRPLTSKDNDVLSLRNTNCSMLVPCICHIACSMQTRTDFPSQQTFDDMQSYYQS